MDDCKFRFENNSKVSKGSRILKSERINQSEAGMEKNEQLGILETVGWSTRCGVSNI